MNSYDAIVIGTGQAGPSLSAALAGAGMRVAVVERHRFGGTCVNVGCIPTKALVASAHAAHVARRAGEFGVVIGGGVSVDMKKIKARKDAIVRRSSEGVEKWLRALDNVTVHTGHARFESPRTIRVEDRILQADRIFINVGARAHVPSFPGLDRVPYRTNSSMMAVDSLPEHLVIVGGGYIGIEFAQMYRRFGSRVTLIHRGDRLLPRESADVSSAVREILESEGVEVRLNADCVRVDTVDDRIVAGVTCDDGPPGVTGSMLLVAAGRRPNTDDLGLEAAGVEVDARGHVRVDDALATSVPGVWALGECNGRGAFTHTAYNDYEIVAANLLHGDRRRVSDRIDCYGLFIDPPLGRVGMTERQVRASGRPALVGKRPMTRVGRAVQRGETQGFMKVLVDASNKQILGAAILGVGGDEAVHAILDVMYAKAPYTVIQRAVHIHPTVAELVPTMLGDLQPLA
ncbi:MAG: FAD-containing oxidoreductase [Acidobacteria bacterium]|nr:FAD-containing oxidoreductase [Acidobacteriota bacterium]MYH31868.1 FAD-containing oxidoreductase [Acidobacteriota bacterium]MYK87467.1 FAD-containing oxidoreductase [Acidobacteriota bacterium]